MHTDLKVQEKGEENVIYVKFNLYSGIIMITTNIYLNSYLFLLLLKSVSEAFKMEVNEAL